MKQESLTLARRVRGRASTTSDGLQMERPKFFVSRQRKLRLLQRRLKGKQLGSANWKKQQKKIARLHEHIANTRKDFYYKAAHRLCDGADVVAVEKLNRIGLSRGFLGKHTLDAGHGQSLAQILPYIESSGLELAQNVS